MGIYRVYTHSIVTKAVSAAILEIFNVKEWPDLDIHKTRMNGLSRGEESVTICSAVLIQCQRVTDGRTDGRTDVQPISITCFSKADARKNEH